MEQAGLKRDPDIMNYGRDRRIHNFKMFWSTIHMSFQSVRSPLTHAFETATLAFWSFLGMTVRCDLDL